MNKLTCTNCGAENFTSAKYCSNCGYTLPIVSMNINANLSEKTNKESQRNVSTERQQILYNQPLVIVTKSTKSVGIAILLVAIFGPLGMFYSTIGGAIFMSIMAPVIFFFILMSGNLGYIILGLIIYYPICMIWASTAVSSYNRKIINQANQR